MNDYLEFKSLSHHGIKGQRWGVRRFQNEDGSLKPAGLKKQAKDADKQELNRIKKELNKKNKTHLKSMFAPTGNSFAENEFHNRRIVNRAAKYVKNNKMTYTEALDKSNNVAIRNAVLGYVGVLGATVISSIIAIKKADMY